MIKTLLTCSSLSEGQCCKLFCVLSDDFHKSLRELIAKIILENLSSWRTQAINNQGKGSLV